MNQCQGYTRCRQTKTHCPNPLALPQDYRSTPIAQPDRLELEPKRERVQRHKSKRAQKHKSTKVRALCGGEDCADCETRRPMLKKEDVQPSLSNFLATLPPPPPPFVRLRRKCESLTCGTNQETRALRSSTLLPAYSLVIESHNAVCL